MPAVIAILLAALLSWSGAQQAAPAVQVGVIVSRSGQARVAGASQALAANGWANATGAAGGVFGVSVDVLVEDDAGSPERAAELTRQLADQGALAVVCCTTPAATAAVAPVAEELGLLHMALTDPAAGSFGANGISYWSFGLWPSETDQLSAVVADALTAGRGTVALMTTDDTFGDEVRITLESLLGYAGMRLVHVERYAAGTTELRPEALVLAAQQPGAVVVWGTRTDTDVAVNALRARGYEGIVYARSVLAMPASGRGLPATVYAGVRFALPPVYPTTVPSTHACAAAVTSVGERVSQLYGGVADLTAAAGVVDSLDLLAAAIEQLFLLQLPADSPVPVLRQALRDAAVGLGPRCAATGLLDLQEGRRSAVVPSSLVAPTLSPSGDWRVP